MSKQDLEVILSELRQARKAIAEAVQQIIQQESEIKALRLLLESKGLVSAEELAAAGVQSHEFQEFLSRPASEGSGRQSGALLTAQNKRRPYLCRPGL
jgi:hypothetical protein